MTLSYATERNTDEDWFDLSEKCSNDKETVKVKSVGEKLLINKSFCCCGQLNDGNDSCNC